MATKFVLIILISFLALSILIVANKMFKAAIAILEIENEIEQDFGIR